MQTTMTLGNDLKTLGNALLFGGTTLVFGGYFFQHPHSVMLASRLPAAYVNEFCPDAIRRAEEAVRNYNVDNIHLLNNAAR